MRARAVALPVVVGVAVWAVAGGPAAADVVHLVNGNEIPGRVVSEDAERVVVRTTSGRLTIPRREVARIDREGEARTLLREARLAATAGDAEAARRLYAAAEAAGEADVAAIARREREALARAPAVTAPPAADATAPAGDDPFVEVEREALIRELEAAASERPALAARLAHELYRRGVRRHEARECRLAVSDFRRARRWADAANHAALEGHERRCRLQVAAQALRREPAVSRAAVEPLQGHAEDGVRAAYLLGRAEERLRRSRAAREAFTRALGAVPVPEDHDLPTLRELARLAAAGLPVDAATPGLAAGWRCTQTEHFSLLHEGPLAPGVTDEVERLRAEVLARLALTGVDDEARIALFLFATAQAYQASPGARTWSAGHAARLQGDGEVVPTIYLHLEGDADGRLRHELAHIVVGDALDDALLPMWAAEGVAIYAEHEASRRMWRMQARALAARGQLRPTRDALAQMLLPLTEDRAEVGRFYVQASLLFDVLAARVGVQRALECAQHINTQGPEDALRSVGERLDGIERDVEAALR